MNSAFAKDDIAVSVIDALTSQICVVDPRGVIFQSIVLGSREKGDNN